MLNNAIINKVMLCGDDRSEHVGYPGRIQNNQVLQGDVAAIGSPRKIQYYAQIMHELQCRWNVLLCHTTLKQQGYDVSKPFM